MIARLIILIALLVLYFYCRSRLKNTPKAQRKQLILTWILWAAVAAVVAMALTGRLHWIGGLLAMMVPIIRQGVLWFVQKRLNQTQAKQQQEPGQATAQKPMDVAEALKLFNLEPGFNQDQLSKAHRRMMQKNHPDQGGSDYLAALINQAKDVLDQELKQRP